jgi:hypothetical protein
MLEGKYGDARTREPYETWPTFPSLLYVGVGVNRSFADEPRTVSGISFPLRRPTEIGHAVRDRITAHIMNQDPTLAPPGKTSLMVMLPDSYAYWMERTPAPITKPCASPTIPLLVGGRQVVPPACARRVARVEWLCRITVERGVARFVTGKRGSSSRIEEEHNDL